jgi:Ser/Thr protein kinase RdoA (MazF antagonist)
MRGVDGQMRQALAAWGLLTIAGRLGGGNRNLVLEVRLGRQRAVARRSRRPPASLDWEISLLDHLAGHGMRVPIVLSASDGRRHVDGVLVQSWLPGAAPAAGDWDIVASTLTRLHELTAGWPQRPGFASTRDLLTTVSGGDVDLAAMPAAAVSACRTAWSGLAGRPQAVVHGDPGPANIRIGPGGCGLLDWDEARVDYTALDLAELPGSPLPPGRLRAAQAAATAWEAANGWIVEPSYARRQLARLAAGQHGFG